MPTWLVIAAVATIGITALLVGLLYRINAPQVADARKRPDTNGGDGGMPYVAVDGHHSRDDADANDGGDAGGSDGGGGDGGGGGGD